MGINSWAILTVLEMVVFYKENKSLESVGIVLFKMKRVSVVATYQNNYFLCQVSEFDWIKIKKFSI